jgi:hypothetical protein
MRRYESIIFEGELMALPAESVRARLIEVASKAIRYDSNEILDSETEESLRLRRDPLIDLSLAQYGRYVEAVKPIFHNSPPGSALRLATLANQNFSNAFLSNFPSDLFEELEDQIQWLIHGEESELTALFQNPTISDRFLRSILEQDNEFARVPDARFNMIVSILAYNPRMSTKRESIYLDGQEDYDHNSVFNAAWTLAERVEPTKKWAIALGWLYAKLELECFSIKEPLQVANRWYPSGSNAELVAKELEVANRAFLSEYEMVRMGLARLATKRNDKLLRELLTHEDRAFRAAAYSNFELTRDLINAAHEKDGELAFQCAIGNEHLWRTVDGREMLRSLSRLVTDSEKSGYMDAANQFRHTAKHMEQEHPDWFKDEPGAHQEEIEEHSKPATQKDLADLERRLGRVREGGLLDEIGKHVNWLLMIGGATLVAALFKNH